MYKLNKSIVKLVESQYDSEMKSKVEEYLKNTKETTSAKGYIVLAIGLEDILPKMSEEDVNEYYGMRSIRLASIDKTVAQILTSLSTVTGDNIKENYLQALQLSNDAPELDYLASVVKEYLKGKFN